jgi:hypothetical protein
MRAIVNVTYHYSWGNLESFHNSVTEKKTEKNEFSQTVSKGQKKSKKNTGKYFVFLKNPIFANTLF